MKKRILCAVLCYNNENTIKNVLKDINKIRKKIDILFINDFSQDKTLNILKKNNEHIISHKKNLGYGAAVKSGYKYALKNNYYLMSVLPGDHQRSAKDLEKLIFQQKKRDFDLVSGSKFLTQNKLFISRKFGNIFFSGFAKIFWNSKFEDNLSGFKVYKVSKFKNIIRLMPDDYSFDICLNQIIFRKKFFCSEIRVMCKYNNHTSKMKNIFNLSKRNILFIGFKMIINSFSIFINFNKF